MISSEKIGETIKNPQLIHEIKLEDLAELRNKYAYCSTLHLLYLKGLALTNDVQFEDHLRYAAAHVMDRERLYYLIHSTGGEDTITQQNLPVENKEINVETVSAKNRYDNELKEAVLETEELIKEDKSTVQNTDLNKSTHEFEISEKQNEPAKINESLESSKEEDEETIESTILPTIAVAVYEKELTLSANKPEKTNDTETVQTDSSVIKPKEDVAKERIKFTDTDKKVDLSKLSFIEWLKYKQQITTGNTRLVDVQSPQLSEDALQIEDTKITTPILQQVDNEKTAKKSLSKTDVDALLNKFIREEPSISRPKTAFFSPIKNAKQSLEETTDLVTETLAKIYALQKNYARAIEAYEKLILVYPEKKTFFASQIEKIKLEQHK